MATELPIDLDALTLQGVLGGSLRGRPVTVLGLARSGLALARFFANAGAEVTVYDGRPLAELADAVVALEGGPARILAGPDVEPETAWAGASLVATSPSINPDYPTTEPRLRAALQDLVARHVADPAAAPALVSEADLFLRLCPAPTIGVTGTKGKTTTSSLIAAILAADPDHPVILGGNIGIPLVERLPELTPEHRVVIELSELQLPTLSRGTTVAVYTNVTSDHLDRHGSLESYRAAKRRLAELVDPDGALILNLDDPVVAAYADGARAKVIGYRFGPPPAGGVGLVDRWLAADDGREIMAFDELAIPGRHNASNALAAIAVGLEFGVAPEAIRRAAMSFTAVEHRLEPVAVVDGVRYFNDSQGTQPDAVIAALHAFDVPVILIAGGRDKGIDLRDLAKDVANRAIAAVLIGESGPTLERLFREAGLLRTSRAESMREAVQIADGYARELLATYRRLKESPEVQAYVEEAKGRPDTTGSQRARGRGLDTRPVVLLSPAAASFDMFEDYAARGRAFKDAVAELADERLGESES